MNKVTEWFEMPTWPKHIGVYEVQVSVEGFQRFSYWDGKGWGFVSDEPTGAYWNRFCATPWIILRWRGLAIQHVPYEV